MADSTDTSTETPVSSPASSGGKRGSWKAAWSLGQGCGAVEAIRPAGELIARLAADWRAAKGG